MAFISELARQKKCQYFLAGVAKDARILEIGSSDGALAKQLKPRFANYCTLDLLPPADIVGDIRSWRTLGLAPSSFDVIIAFEVIEHVHCFQEAWDLLKPNGRLMITSPVPHWDGVMRLLEVLGLNQKRTSPHDNLIYFEDIPLFEAEEIRRRAFLAQWGIFRKGAMPRRPAPAAHPIAVLAGDTQLAT